MTAPSTCVIYNPTAGRGGCRARLEKARAWLGSDVVFRPTSALGHGVTLARQAVEDGFERIIAAGGDGTVHEVANGILTSGGHEVVLGVLPLGSANDYASALGVSNGSEPTRRTLVDVARVRACQREVYSVNCIGIGFNGLVSAAARQIRGLKGMPLYTAALLRTLIWQYATPKMRVMLAEELSHRPTLSLSLNIGQREGNFPITRHAVLDDGFLDVVRVGAMRRRQLIRYLPALMCGELPCSHPELHVTRCMRASVESEVPLCVHVDGEMFLLPGDGVKGVEVEVVPRRLRVERRVF